MANGWPINGNEKMSDMLSDMMRPPEPLNTTEDFENWEMQLALFAGMAGAGDEDICPNEVVINIMTKIAIGERRKNRCEDGTKSLNGWRTK